VLCRPSAWLVFAWRVVEVGLFQGLVFCFVVGELVGLLYVSVFVWMNILLVVVFFLFYLWFGWVFCLFFLFLFVGVFSDT